MSVICLVFSIFQIFDKINNDVWVIMSVFKPTVELGVLVPYPEEGREAKDHLRPSALRKEMETKKTKREKRKYILDTEKMKTVFHCSLTLTLVSILVPHTYTIGCYALAIPPHSPTFKLPNYI